MAGLSYSWILILIAIAVGMYHLHRLGLWMEQRGWIYYKKKRGSGLFNALQEVDAILLPGERHVQEAMQEDRAGEQEEADAGELKKQALRER